MKNELVIFSLCFFAALCFLACSSKEPVSKDSVPVDYSPEYRYLPC